MVRPKRTLDGVHSYVCKTHRKKKERKKKEREGSEGRGKGAGGKIVIWESEREPEGLGEGHAYWRVRHGVSVGLENCPCLTKESEN